MNLQNSMGKVETEESMEKRIIDGFGGFKKSSLFLSPPKPGFSLESRKIRDDSSIMIVSKHVVPNKVVFELIVLNQRGYQVFPF